MRKLILLLILMSVVLIAAKPRLDQHRDSMRKASDEYVREAVVQLKGEHGLCTGVQIKTAAGKRYVLTAAHCRGLLGEDNKVLAIGEYKQEETLSFVAEDELSDLMLLSGSDRFQSIDVAQDLGMREHVHTLTHGGGAPTYRTDGEALDEVVDPVMVFPIDSEESLENCKKMPKYKVEQIFIFEGCVLNVKSTRTTAQIVPGSSGGPMLNDLGQLTGIASYGNGQFPIFGYFVRLADIQSFLARTAI